MVDRFIHPAELTPNGPKRVPMLDTLHECRAQASVPSLPFDRCLAFYESRTFYTGPLQGRRIEIRVTYEHCLLLLGCQQGGLLYATTLLPGEEIRLFELARFPRLKSSNEQASVHTSFRQALNTMPARHSTSSSGYADEFADIRTRARSPLPAESGIANSLSAPRGRTELGLDVQSTLASDASIHVASEQFSQSAAAASQAVGAERLLVVSRFEEAGFQSTVTRRLKNENSCYAVTYYIRRVNETYKVSTLAIAVEWRIGGRWRTFDDLDGVEDALRKMLEDIRRRVPRVGDASITPRGVTLPIDVTLYEAELARSSDEPMQSEDLTRLERPGLQAPKACFAGAAALERRGSYRCDDSSLMS